MQKMLTLSFHSNTLEFSEAKEIYPPTPLRKSVAISSSSQAQLAHAMSKLPFSSPPQRHSSVIPRAGLPITKGSELHGERCRIQPEAAITLDWEIRFSSEKGQLLLGPSNFNDIPPYLLLITEVFFLKHNCYISLLVHVDYTVWYFWSPHLSNKWNLEESSFIASQSQPFLFLRLSSSPMAVYSPCGTHDNINGLNYLERREL